MFHRRHLRRGQKRGSLVGKTKRGKGTTLVEPALDTVVTRADPIRLIGDAAYDSDPLDRRLTSERGGELIAPHRRNRRRPPRQDARPRRRYCRRWKIERLFAWLQNFRRIVTRHESHTANYLGFVQLGCVIILLRHL